jgi:predicted lipoprotein with Yx(FWY)xxD motif
VTRSPLSRFLAGPVLLLMIVGAAACGTSAPAEPSAPEAAAAAAAPEGHGGGHGGHGSGGHGSGGHGSGDPGSPVVPAPTLYAVQTGPLGIILTDGSGHLIYRSDTDSATPPTSTCTDACAETWIPVTAPPDQELDLAGVKEELVGRLQRPDGSSQLTLAGWPLYRHHDDDGSLATAGQNGADGRWFVVTPKGEKATPPA